MYPCIFISPRQKICNCIFLGCLASLITWTGIGRWETCFFLHLIFFSVDCLLPSPEVRISYCRSQSVTQSGRTFQALRRLPLLHQPPLPHHPSQPARRCRHVKFSPRRSWSRSRCAPPHPPGLHPTSSPSPTPGFFLNHRQSSRDRCHDAILTCPHHLPVKPLTFSLGGTYDF